MAEGWFEDWDDESDEAAEARERRRREREAQRRDREGQPADADGPAAGQARPTWNRAEHHVAPRSRRMRSRGSGPGRIVAAVALLLLGVLAVWFLVALAQPFHGDGGQRVNVEVPEGASVGEIGSVLEEQGVVSDATMFRLRVTLAGKRSEMYPGTYTLSEDMSYGDAIDALSTVPVERTVTVTIPEGVSREEIAPIAEQAGLSGDYLQASQRSRQFDPARYGAPSQSGLEGFLFPATYELPADAGVNALVSNQLRAFKDRMAGIGMRYARDKNLTIYDVVTIASMIEREVSVPRERKLVASVIYNRLRDGIPLGIDATTRYAVGNFTEPLTQSQLESDSPYNTRNRSGLPPGPIGNPGEDALRAAARPANTEFLYYVVEPGTCGRHSFSETYADFERDVAEYNRAREEAGGESPTECP